MIIKDAYYPPNLPTKILLVLPDGHHYMANLQPFRKLTMADLQPLATYDKTIPERYWDKRDRIPDYALRFYGLEKSDVMHERIEAAKAEADRRNGTPKPPTHEREQKKTR